MTSLRPAGSSSAALGPVDSPPEPPQPKPKRSSPTARSAAAGFECLTSEAEGVNVRSCQPSAIGQPAPGRPAAVGTVGRAKAEVAPPVRPHDPQPVRGAVSISKADLHAVGPSAGPDVPPNPHPAAVSLRQQGYGEGAVGRLLSPAVIAQPGGERELIARRVVTEQVLGVRADRAVLPGEKLRYRQVRRLLLRTDA